MARNRSSVTVSAVLLAGTLIALPAPAASAEDTATGLTPTTYIDESFDAIRWDSTSAADWWNWPNTISRGPVQGLRQNATRVTMRAGTNIGAMLDWEFERHGYAEPEEAYFRYWMRFDDAPASTGKLPGFMGLYSSSGRGKVAPSESRPGWSARVMFGPGDGDDSLGLGFYTYHLDQAGSTGDAMWWEIEAPLDQWVCVEGRVAMNTPGAANGELQAWLNDVEVFHRSDVAFRTAAQADVRIKQFMFEVYHGGGVARYDTGVAFDELRVADQRIGCSTGMPSFADTGQSPFVDDIEWLVANGITVGCNPPYNTMFCPRTAVTRSHLAAFLHRGLVDVIEVQEPAGPADPPTMWGLSTPRYAEAIGTMTAATGAPIDLVHVATNLDTGSWTGREGWGDPFGSFHRPPIQTMPLQLSTIHRAGSVPYVTLRTTDIETFVARDRDAEFDGWLDGLAAWLGDDPTRRLMIAPFPDANRDAESNPTSVLMYRAAYRMVYGAFRERGIEPEQARFVFQMSADAPITSYWPGNAFTDLAALSSLNASTGPWDDWDSRYANLIAEVASDLGPDVPVLLAVASTPFNVLGDQRGYWFEDLAAGISATPNAIGVVYLDRDRDGSRYGVDSATDPDPAFVDFVNRIGSPGHRLDWVFDGSMDRWKEETIAALPSSVFVDDDGSAFETEMVWLARSGITSGCNPPINDRFCPDDRVTRGQTAAFLHRALGDMLPGDDPGVFTDIDGSPYASDIAWLSSTGIALPCNPPANDRFCPNAEMTRGDMAAALRLALSGLSLS